MDVEMLKNTPTRLSRWILLHEQPERLALEHEAIIDLAWAADEIAKLRLALRFYASEAEAIARNFDKNDDAVLASVTVLKLDAGNKAKET